MSHSQLLPTSTPMVSVAWTIAWVELEAESSEPSCHVDDP